MTSPSGQQNHEGGGAVVAGRRERLNVETINTRGVLADVPTLLNEVLTHCS